MNLSRPGFWKRLPALFEIPALDSLRALRRIVLMERNVMVPVKIFFIAVIVHSFNYSPWVGQISSTPDVVVETVEYLFFFYVPLSVALVLPVIFFRRMPLALLQWTAVTNGLVDAILLGGMALLTGGLDSILFWFFIGLILRNAVSIPPGFSQIILNVVTSLCYASVILIDVALSENPDELLRRTLDLSPREDWGEPLLLRMAVLGLMTITAYGVQLFLERQRLALEEAEEFFARENQLRSAGRLAAEFAHQIKNPLAIINNAAFSLQRSLPENKNSAAEQLAIIREEVSRADRVITQIMGYAQLSEGRVEKLNVTEELDRAIAQVFPTAVTPGIEVQKNFAGHFPPLLMQRGHLSEILVNLLQNAREATAEKGMVNITAESGRDHAVEISVSDNGPGIGPDKLERIFEAYYTTKERGTGLGLAIVKHNVELYGGSIRVESNLGQGAKFTVIFPAKTLPKPSIT